MGGDGREDLAELDAVAADLDLIVAAAEVLVVAGGEESGDIPGSVEAPFAAGDDAFHEALGGELGPIEVAARHAGAADPDLAGLAGETGNLAGSRR